MAKTRRHPLCIGVDEICEKFASFLTRQGAILIENLVCAAQVGFRLLNDQDIEENERLAQVMIGAKPADCAW
ncbi:hypothetical protein MesoLjLc_07570 [Mesorhizobium sp. L-8-10]|uniref:hypothetical protein n=1 Tax=Mesorhizobium sp. L-8-10 TaxID=2744523 RepID=UPI0019361519|nr:hypothetical protein MesoLjLc_07570 [Mesorhizobium sp. L-8-10]